MTNITFTKHAMAKFEILKRHGVEITLHQVSQVILEPDKVMTQPGSRVIAQKRISDRHVLRVVLSGGGTNTSRLDLLPGKEGTF